MCTKVKSEQSFASLKLREEAAAQPSNEDNKFQHPRDQHIYVKQNIANKNDCSNLEMIRQFKAL